MFVAHIVLITFSETLMNPLCMHEVFTRHTLIVFIVHYIMSDRTQHNCKVLRANFIIQPVLHPIGHEYNYR